MTAVTTAANLLKSLPTFSLQTASRCICSKTFARPLKCHIPSASWDAESGIILTASHNPKEYNGYKAYWDDGARMIAPHDKNTIAEVNKIRNASEIKFKGNKELIEIIGKEIDEQYINDLTKISLSPESIARHHDMKIVYTPIHGTGVTVIPPTLKAFGFTNIIHVPEQDVVSGDFPYRCFSQPGRTGGFGSGS